MHRRIPYAAILICEVGSLFDSVVNYHPTSQNRSHEGNKLLVTLSGPIAAPKRP